MNKPTQTKIILEKFDELWRNTSVDERNNLTNFEFFQAGFLAGKNNEVELQEDLFKELYALQELLERIKEN